MNDLTDISPLRGPALALAPEAPPEPGFRPFGEDGFTFFDFLDIINPLQHIPLISNIYRNMTGDTLDPAPRVLGGTLFGGPIGLIASIISVIVEEGTGKDPGDHLLALLEDDGADAGDGGDKDIEEIAAFGTAAGEETDGPIVETTLAEINVLRIEAGLPPVPVNAPPVELAAVTPVPPAPPAVQASPGRAHTDARGAPATAASGAGLLPWFAGQADAPARPAQVARRTPSLDPGPRREAGSAAVAPSGGWFSDVMLTALARYEEGAKLSDATTARRLNITN